MKNRLLSPDLLLLKSRTRTTRPRRAIIETLASAEHPLSPQEIHDRLAKKNTIDLVTIYRTLALFEEKHIAHCHPSTGGYLLCSLPETDGHHGFLTCISCKKTEEFHEPKFCAIEDSIARKAKFRATEHISEIIGHCSHCS